MFKDINRQGINAMIQFIIIEIKELLCDIRLLFISYQIKKMICTDYPS